MVLVLAGCTTNNPAFQGDLGGTAPADMTGPRSDMVTPAPPQCLHSGDCLTQICLQSGMCAPQGAAVYVDNAGGSCRGTHTGTQDDPLCTLAQGLVLAQSSGRHTIFVGGSAQVYESFTVSGQTVNIYGPGPLADPVALIQTASRTHAAVQVLAGATVVLDGLELVSTNNDVVYCDGVGGPPSSLTVSRSYLHDGGQNGIYATHCNVSVNRSAIGLNGETGADVEQGSTLSVLNSFIFNNGPAGNVGLRAPEGNALSVRFSTVKSNGGGAADCGAAGNSRQIDTSLIFGNGKAGNGDTITAACQLTRSAIDQGSWPNGSANHFNAKPTFTATLGLQPTQGSTSCCIDQLDPGPGVSDIIVDYDGTSRPQGSRWDIGAQEVR